MSALARRIVSEEVFTVADGVDTSGDVSIESGAVGLLLAASTWASNTAATFEVSNDGDNWFPVNAATATLVAGEWVKVPEEVMYGKFMRVVLGANAAQEETLTLCLKG